MNHQLQRALADAAWDGDHITVVALINHPGVDPAAHHSAALLHAAHRGHWRCVQLLLPVSDPNARNAEALWRAAKHRHARVVRLLAPVSDTSLWEDWQWAEISGKARRWCCKEEDHRSRGSVILLH
jgi:hypothetical protein